MDNLPSYDGAPLLHCSEVSKSYDAGKTFALEGVTIDLHRGEFVSIIGSSGAGKSTLLRCVNRLIEPSAGTVVFDGQDVTSLSRRKLREVRCRIAMVFQNYNLVGRSTAIENVLQGRLGYKNTVAGALALYSQEDKRIAAEALERVGLADFAYARADQLSGGQKQRVGIARAFAQEPLVILADEPIASLDPKSSRTVLEHLKQATNRGVGCLVSLHQVEYAVEFSDRIVALAGGKLVYDGAPSGLSTELVSEVYGVDPDSDERITLAPEGCCGY